MIEVPEELEARLQNWGRWARQCRTETSSPLSALARELARVSAEEGKRNPQRPINYQDAEFVNTMWRRMPFAAYEDRKVKLVLAVMYTSTASMRTTLTMIRRIHKVRIRESEVDALFEKGVRRLARSLGYELTCP